MQTGLDPEPFCPYSIDMDKTPWTLMNTSVTRTTGYGYSNTCTLAQAMQNRSYNQLTNLAQCFGSLAGAISQAKPRRLARK